MRGSPEQPPSEFTISRMAEWASSSASTRVAELEVSKAKLKRADVEAATHNAEANWLAQRCRVQSLEIAKLRRLESCSNKLYV